MKMSEAIKIIDLCKNYGEKKAVNKLNLSIEEGEVYALLGVNGAGKSTTIKMLSCLIEPNNGDAFIMGNSILRDSQKVKEIIGVSPQETAIAPNLTVYENIMFIAQIYKISDCKEQVDRIIEDFSLSEIKDKKAKVLSGGWQRRLSIALALVSNPQVLFLDEPTLGLDVIARHELWNTIELLKSKVTIILTTHYLEEVEALADHVGIMHNGVLKINGTIDEIIASGNYKNFEDAFVSISTRKDD